MINKDLSYVDYSIPKPSKRVWVSWWQRVWIILLRAKYWLLTLFAIDLFSFITGFVNKYFVIGSLASSDRDLFFPPPPDSLSALGNFLADSFLHILFGLIVLFTSFFHFGLPQFAAAVGSQFSTGSSLAIFQLAGKPAYLIFFLGYLPDLIFYEIASLLSTYLCLKAGIESIKSIKARKRTPNFYHVHKDMLTMIPLLIFLWIIAAVVSAYVSDPLFSRLVY